MNRRLIISTFVAWIGATIASPIGASAAPPESEAAAPGPSLLAPEGDEKAGRAVRQTLKDINDGMRVAKDARNGWRIERARLQAQKAEADAALQECKARNPKDWEVKCRIQIVGAGTAGDEFRDGMIEAVEGYEERFTPLARSVKKRVVELVETPRNYNYLLVQEGREGGESKLLKLLLISLDTVERLRGQMNVAVTTAYLSDLLETVDQLEKDIHTLEEMSPEIARALEKYDREPAHSDPLLAHAYPANER